MANIEALNQLKRVVKAAPRARFEMADFIVRRRCGTAFCAAGWAAQDPWFIEQGLDMSMLQRYSAFPFLRDFFDLPLDDTFRLFGSDLNPHRRSNIGKRKVLANIDRALSGQPCISYTDPYQ